MPKTRLLAPWVEIFTPDELVVLAEWFGCSTGLPHARRTVLEVLYDLKIPEVHAHYERIDAAVAQIVLERIQDRLPQWAAVAFDAPPGQRVTLGRDIRERRANRKIEVMPRHLFSIDWAMSGPGISWPIAYLVTYVPGFNKMVVTASADSPDAFGACDFALGWFEPTVSIEEGARDIIIRDWGRQASEYSQEHWQWFELAGLIDRDTAEAWADEVWNPPDEDDADECLDEYAEAGEDLA